MREGESGSNLRFYGALFRGAIFHLFVVDCDEDSGLRTSPIQGCRDAL